MLLKEIDYNSGKNLYAQIYEQLKAEISEGRIKSGERLPSLRKMAKDLGISVTTVKIAYDQLTTEGYIESRPQSGFYVAGGVATLDTVPADAAGIHLDESGLSRCGSMRVESDRSKSSAAKTDAGKFNSYDPETFDFIKWKKCMSIVLNETPELLLSEADRQGELPLRSEISSYLYRSRGVICMPDQVIVSAGTQQLVGHIIRLLKLMGIEHVSVEDPGYTPVKNIFQDWGFGISEVPVLKDGIEIERLPVNVRTAAYVCPQNQFPTGALMPVARRRKLLEWADANDSFVIEDDYNSELRYTGMPVPALQGLDANDRTIYIGSFTSTLFPAAKISYMVLPHVMAGMYDSIKMNYDQTCSKTEQLTLAGFMRAGYYQTNLRRIKKLYSRKLALALSAIEEYRGEWDFVTAENTQSGINLTIRVDSCVRTICEGMRGHERTVEIQRNLTERLRSSAEKMGLKVRSIDQLGRDGQIYLAFYYNQIPSDNMREAVREMIDSFKMVVTMGSMDMPSVYEVIRLADGKAIFLHEHYDRLSRSLAAIGMPMPFDEATLERNIEELQSKTGIKDHNIKIEIDVSGHAIMHLNPTHYPDDDMYKNGVMVGIMRGERKNPNIKMMDRELRDAADEMIRNEGLYEVILVNRDGQITEGSRSNVFFIKDGALYTAPEKYVLQGVTRSKIEDIAKEIGADIKHELISASEICNFDAAFISGTSPKVLPISGIGDVKYDTDDVLLRRIMREYDKLTFRP